MTRPCSSCLPRTRRITFSGTRLVVGLDWTADVAIIDPATERAELVKAATGRLLVKSIAG
ncbi:hypothetical protein [Nonomuraea sp. NPDC002799]